MANDRGIYMSKNDQFSFGVISDFILSKVTRSEAAQLLQMSERSISRKARNIEKNGLFGMQHGNKGKFPKNKTSEILKATVLKLARETYFDFNVSHLREKLVTIEKIEISYPVLYSWCREARLIKRAKRRTAKIRRLRARLPCEGMMLQMDGSHHAWNGKDEWVLIAAIDDATSKIPWAEFFTSEDTLNCMTVLQRIIENYGIPHSIYTDKAGWFGGTTKREGFNQFQNACDELGIRIIYANSAQSKGRIERTWHTFQDRIIPDMRIADIKNIPAANKFLQEDFMPNYWNKQNTVPARENEIKYKPLQHGVDLNEIFTMRETRQVKGNHTISWDNEIYNVKPSGNVSIKGREVELRTYQNMTTKAFFAGVEIEISKASEQPLATKLNRPALRVNNIAGIKRDDVKKIHEENLKYEILTSKMNQGNSKLPIKTNLKNTKEHATCDAYSHVKRKRGRPRKAENQNANFQQAS